MVTRRQIEKFIPKVCPRCGGSIEIDPEDDIGAIYKKIDYGIVVCLQDGTDHHCDWGASYEELLADGGKIAEEAEDIATLQKAAARYGLEVGPNSDRVWFVSDREWRLDYTQGTRREITYFLAGMHVAAETVFDRVIQAKAKEANRPLIVMDPETGEIPF